MTYRMFAIAMWVLGLAYAAPCATATAQTKNAAAPATAAQSAAQSTRAEIKKMLGFEPGFLRATPDSAITGAWQEMRDLQINDKTALPCKIKELIGLAVAAQVPCKYCTYAHTAFARLGGASQQELGEAVVISALARHWSTFMNGIQLDEPRFRKEVSDVVARMKGMSTQKQPPTAAMPVAVTDAKSARAEIEQMFGVAPEFLKRFPDSGIVGAWTEMRDVEMSHETALPGKYKSLISLAVAAQVPCRYCVFADTEFAKLDGATDAEIAEAIGMAALTRHWSTVLNGLAVDENHFREDIDRIVGNARAQQQKQLAAAAKR